jgi:phosphohistidine phosphatase
MTTLLLVRHASAAEGPDDHDRPLTARGALEAEAMAAATLEAGWQPDLILASTARRTRATAAMFGAALCAPVRTAPALYGAGPRTLLDAAVGLGVASVMIVAHNPGIAMLARSLSSNEIGGMVPCAVAAFSWDDDDWNVASATDPDRIWFRHPE